MRPFFVGVTLLFAVGGLYTQNLWTEDWEGALNRARRENKDLLVYFTGSDWCIWCKRLDREVLSTEIFQTQVPKDFVLVKLDFPRNLPQTPALRARNGELQRRYGVEGFPTILLLDSQGRPYARTGYIQGGPQAFLREIHAFRSAKARDWTLLERAERSSGVEKARLLDQFYERMVVAENASFFDDLIDEIIGLDANNQAGLRTKYTIKRDFHALRDGLREGSDWNRVLRDLSALETRSTTAQQTLLRQEILMTRAAINLNVLENRGEAKNILEAIHSLDPNSRWGAQVPDLLRRLGL